MKRLITYILILFACLGLWQSCIDDESEGFVRELSKIDIETSQDTFYADFGVETTIQATVSQTGEGNMTYEWRWAPADDYGQVWDSLKIISTTTEPILHYSFRELGQFRVRLRATNEDGSSFYYFQLYVRTPFQEGILVLSKDENKLGRSSFLRVKESDDVVSGDEEFTLHAFEGVNSDIVLNDPQDMSWTKNYMMVVSDGGKSIHQYHKLSFDYVNTIKVDGEYPEARIQRICLGSSPDAFNSSLCWGVNRDTWIVDYDIMYVLPDTRYAPGAKYDKCYFSGSGHGLFMNFEESYINHSISWMWPGPRFSSEKYFAGRYIVNLMASAENQLYVVTTDPQDAQSVTITSFTDMDAFVGWFQPVGAFMNPEDYTYHVDQPLTLTRDAEMLTNNAYYVTLYARGNELYQWVYKGMKLPDTPLLTLDGEITCMCLSPDNKYVYLGVWNPTAKEQLKGSIYILDMKTSKIVREYRGVADKPMKIMYKKSK